MLKPRPKAIQCPLCTQDIFSPLYEEVVENIGSYTKLRDQLRRRNLQIKDLKRELTEAVKYFNLNEQGKAREKTSEFLNTLKK